MGFESKCIFAINRFCQFTSGAETKEGFILFQTLKIFMAPPPLLLRKIAITTVISQIAPDLYICRKGAQILYIPLHPTPPKKIEYLQISLKPQK